MSSVVQFLKNLKLAYKLIMGFVLISLIFIAVGFFNYRGIVSVNSKTHALARTASNVDAAMEMKLAVARDMQILMEMLAAQTPDSILTAWNQHQKNNCPF